MLSGCWARTKEKETMALSEVQKNDKIEVVASPAGEWASVQVRTATIIKRDDVELTRSFFRHVVMPDADLSAEDADVQAICNAVFTQDCKDAYAAWVEAQAVSQVEDQVEE
jgi:DNA/RNA endonuclease G (NUC1)